MMYHLYVKSNNSSPQRAGSPLKRWIILGSYSLLILATLSIVRRLRDLLTNAIGASGFSVCVSLLMGLVGIIAVVGTLRRKECRSPRRIVALALGVALYAFLISRLDLAVERLHYAQYGLAAILALYALAPSFPNAGTFFLAFFYVAALGLLDEGIQWVIPNRVGEIRDVGINISAGALGLFLGSIMGGDRFLKLRPDRRAWAAILRVAGGLVLGTALFLTFVHGFGHLHTSEDGTIFKSVFTRAEFDSIGATKQAVAWREVSASPLSSTESSNPWEWLTLRIRQWKAYRHPSPLAYNYEAWRHRQLRDGLETPRYGSFRKALEEERLLRAFYTNYIDTHDLHWLEEKRMRYASMPPKEEWPYMSPVQELLVTWIGPRGFWTLTICLCVALFFGSIFVTHRR